MSVGNIIKYATQFALAGFHVFPLFKSRNNDRNYVEPVGWNGNRPDDPRSIPATTDVNKINGWSDQSLYGYGICGWKKFVLVDLDNKNGKNGVANFKVLREKYNIPKPFLVVKTKSGGAHAFYKRSIESDDRITKQVNFTLDDVKYAGVDIFCDEGYVVGPTSSADWTPGSYTILNGSITDELPEFPVKLLAGITEKKPHVNQLASELCDLYQEPSTKDKIRMGQIPESIPCGERDSMLMSFIGYHKSHGLSKDAVTVLAQEFLRRCELDKGESKESLAKSLDVQGKVDRIFAKEVNIDNPIEISKFIKERSYKLTEEVPGKNMFILTSDTGLGLDVYVPKPAEQFIQDLKKYERPVQISSDENVKPKLINPFTYLVNNWDNQFNTVSYFGYKPTNEIVFEHALTGKKILNSYQAPFINFIPTRIESGYIKLFENYVQWLWGEDLSEFAFNWITHLVKTPELKMSVAPILISQSHGVGKNVFVYNVASMVGISNFANSSMNVILDKHFSMTDKVLIQINEVAAHHATQRHILIQFMSKLKDLISEYSLTINPKFKSERDVPFFGNFILCSNSVTSTLLEIDDRRFVINNILHTGLAPEFTNIAAMVKDQTISNDIKNSIFYSLRQHFLEKKSTMDLSNYRAQMTSQKEEIMINAMAPSHALIYEYFKDDEHKGVVQDIVSGELIQLIARKLGISEVERKSYLIKSLLEQHIIEPVRVMPTNKHPKDTRKFVNLPEFDPDHDLLVFPKDRSTAKKQLYTVRNHKKYNPHHTDSIIPLYLENIESLVIQKFNADVISLTRSASA